MRHPKIVFISVILALVLVWIMVIAYSLLNSRSSRFMRKDAAYYSEFSHACDLLLAQHRLGTNEFLAVSAEDKSLPEILNNLHPRRVELRPHRVWIQVGESRADGFGVTWKQDDIQTNAWSLSVAGESLDKVLYTTNR